MNETTGLKAFGVLAGAVLVISLVFVSLSGGSEPPEPTPTATAVSTPIILTPTPKPTHTPEDTPTPWVRNTPTPRVARTPGPPLFSLEWHKANVEDLSSQLFTSGELGSVKACRLTKTLTLAVMDYLEEAQKMPVGGRSYNQAIDLAEQIDDQLAWHWGPCGLKPPN